MKKKFSEEGYGRAHLKKTTALSSSVGHLDLDPFYDNALSSKHYSVDSCCPKIISC
jgi:hypothetical protein